mmetsp:Transcript_47482/g.75070  ORF Transcript_47482/g.75070 Transcript_47482/m.75070 type:complete len:242 (+) Transcript_47482:72-797(+)
MKPIVALACLASTCHARRLQSFDEDEERLPDSLASFLLSFDPIVSSRARSAQVTMSNFPPRQPSPHSVTASVPARVAKAPSQFSELHSYNTELVNSIEDLHKKREEWDRQIAADNEEKDRIKTQIAALKANLEEIDASLLQKSWQRNEYDRTIKEADLAYSTILKSSQDLVQFLKRESVSLSSKKQAPNEVTGPASSPVKSASGVKSNTEAPSKKNVGSEDANAEDLRKMTLKAAGMQGSS